MNIKPLHRIYRPTTTPSKEGSPKTISTPHYVFNSDGTSEGDAAIAAMQAVCEKDYTTFKSWYAGRDLPNLPITVTFIPSNDPAYGGAYHNTCADTGIFVSYPDAASLLDAEVSECFQALDGNYDCGQTDGEGLSRASAETMRPFQTWPAPAVDGDVAGWWNNGNPQDYVNDNSATDQDGAGNACGTLFVFWLVSQKGYSWNQVVAAKGSTLGDKYASLSGDTGANGFAAFVNDLKQTNIPNLIANNPFPVGSPAPNPNPNPTPTPTPEPTPTGGGCGPTIALLAIAGLVIAIIGSLIYLTITKG